MNKPTDPSDFYPFRMTEQQKRDARLFDLINRERKSRRISFTLLCFSVLLLSLGLTLLSLAVFTWHR